MLKKLKLLAIASILVVPLILSPIRASAATTVAITSPTSGEEVTGTSFTVTGTATADRLITVSVNGDEVGTTTSDGSGDWSLEVTGQDAGAKTITAVASIHYAYVTNSGDATISVLDTDTDQKIGSNISSGVNQPTLVIRSDNDQMVTAGALGSDQVRVWDLSDPAVPTITDSITSQYTHTLGLAYTPDGSEFWTVSTDFGGNTSIRSYDSSNPATTANITGYTGFAGITIGFNGAGDKAYVTDCADNAIHVIDVATKAETSTFAAGCGGIVVGPNDVSFLVDSTNDSVKPLNLAGESAGSGIAVGDAPLGIMFNTDGSRAYVPSSSSNNISVINTNTNTVIDTIPLTGGPKTGIFDSAGSKAYIARSTTDQVVVVDAETFSELSNIDVGDSPVGVVAGPSESATTSVDFTLVAASSSSSDDVLADTGQNTHLYLALATGLLVAPIVYLRKRYITK